MNRTLSEVLLAVLHAMGRPAAIAALLGVSRQRALQLLAKHGLGSIAAALKWATTATPEAKQRRKNRGTNTSPLKQKAKWRREGLCLGGGCPLDDGYLYCSAHRATRRGYDRRIADSRRAKGLCPRCGGLPLPGEKTCPDCQKYHAKRKNK